MRALRRSTRLAACFLVVLTLSLGWPAAPPAESRSPLAPAGDPAPAAAPRVAYVYNADAASRDSFKALLELRGFQVDVVSLLDAQQFDFSVVGAILIGDDTGDDAHGWLGGTTALSNIATAGKYTIGLGLGGAHFFDLLQLGIGHSNTQVASDVGATAVNPGAPFWSAPNSLSLPAGTLQLYTLATPLLAADDRGLGPNSLRVGQRVDPKGLVSYPLVAQRIPQRAGYQCNLLWGFRRAPNAMTPAGQDVFENLLRGDPCAARVAYIYNTDTASRDSFAALLASRGLGVDLVSLVGAETFNFAGDQAIVIGNDTGDLNVWGTPAAVTRVQSAGKPIVGVGEGGYAFFGKLALAIGWAQGWQGPTAGATVVNAAQPIYAAPYPVAVADGDLLTLTTVETNTVEILMAATPPAGVSPIGRSLIDPQHYPLIAQRTAGNRCYALWGSSGAPAVMTDQAADVFMNMLLGQPCGAAPGAAADLSIAKTSAPNPVRVGSNLIYQLTVANAGPSAASGVKVVDTLPADVTFVSATPSQGSCAQAAGVVTCQLGTLAAGGAVASVTIVVMPTKTGTLANAASVVSGVPDPNSANNSISIATSVNPRFVLPPIQALPYKPAVFTTFDPIVKPDLSIFGIEITQGIQCFDTSKGLVSCATNSLPVVAKKDTTARIYLKCAGAMACPLSGVPVRLHIFANGVEYVANVSGKATTSINQGVHDAAEVYFNVNFTNDVGVSFYAEVDPAGAVGETNETNNRYPASGTISMNFRRRASLAIVGQRLRYHPSGYTGQQYAGGWAVNGGAADWYEQVLPVRNNGIDYSVASGYKDWTTSLGGGAGQHALIQSLNTQWILQNAFAWLFGAGSFTGARHIYGWAPGAGYSGGHADMPIYPHAGGLGVVGIGSDAPGTTTDSPGSGALIFGHELTHDYDVLHTNTADACGSGDDDSDFPYGSSSIQEYGFNPITGKIYDPATTHDLMSYCPSGGSKQGWIAPFTWSKMFNKLAPTGAREASAPAAAGSALVVNATIDNPALGKDAGALGELHKVDAPVPATPLAAGSYAVQLKNSLGDVLGEQTFAASFVSEYHAAHPLLAAGDPAQTPRATVSFVMPWAEGTTTIELWHNGSLLDARPVSAGLPLVQITSPSSPVSWPAGSTQTLIWAGADPDGDALTYSVLYSSGGGEWELLANGLTSTSFTLAVDSLAGGANTRFRVVANDGVNIGMDETNAPISVPNKLPSAIIANPADGTDLAPGSLLVLQGLGSDLEDGHLPDEALAWSSDRQGALGVGPSLALTTLAPGLHTITLTVMDAAGQTNSASVKLFVGHRVFTPAVRK
jgi:uncharacterized repeat protein (TIGR01451 family)